MTTTTDPSLTPAAKAKAGAGAAAGFLGGFAPWILYWILTGAVSFRVAISVALAASVALNIASLARRRTPLVLEVGTTVAFALLAIIGFTTNDVFISRWIQPLGNAAFFAIMFASVLVGKPFTLQYAEQATPEEMWTTPGFLYVNRLLTWVWVGATAFMTVVSLIPPIAQGDATMEEGGSPLSIVCYWVLPYSAMAVAVVFTAKFPAWFSAEFDDPDPDQPADAGASGASSSAAGPAVLPPTADHRTEGSLTLVVEPHSVALSDPTRVVVAGASSGAPVVVQASTVDVLGNLWSSSTTFAADADGAVDTSTAAAVDGGYTGVDPDGLIWSMAFATAGRVPDLYVPSPAANAVAISADVQGATLTQVAVRQGWPDGSVVHDVHGDGFVGRLVLPPGPGPFPAVALFGGSEGGIDSQLSNAAVLAGLGFASLAVGYFGLDGLPAQLVQIPLESLASGLRQLAARPEVDGDRVAAMAISRGAEGLLATAALIADLPLRALILVSPSSVSWTATGDGGTLPGTPSWTVGGEPVAHLDMSDMTLMRSVGREALHDRGRRNPLTPHVLHLHDAYAAALRTPAAEPAAIPAERIDAPILCLSGEADDLWPSSLMADAILGRRSHTGDEHVRHPDAGHLIRLGLLATTVAETDGIAFGGTPAGLAAAQRDATERVRTFLGSTFD